MSRPALLRIVVLALLAAAVVLGPASDPGEGPVDASVDGSGNGSGNGSAAGVVWIGPGRAVDVAAAGDGPRAGPSATSLWAGGLVRAAAGAEIPALLVRDAPAPPDGEELALLDAAARRAPLLVGLPEEAPRLRVSPPADPRVGRAAALAFTLRGAPGDTVPVRLVDDAGPVDSFRVAIGGTGVGAAAFRVRPARAGWHEWRVEVPGLERPGDPERPGVPGRPAAVGDPGDPAAVTTAVTGAWVREAEPPRVLVVAGTPAWETRFVLRALEEGGARVTVVQPLGRGLAVGGTGSPAGLPAAADALEPYDVVFLLAGATTNPAQLRALGRYVAEVGGGVLVATRGPAASALGGVSWTGRTGEVAGDEIEWSLPAELAPLPALAGIRSTAGALGARAPGTIAAATAHGDTLLALSALGRGRVAVLGVGGTWHWRMEGGRVAEHREFWRALADWLAGGLRDPVVVRLSETSGPVGVPVELGIEGIGDASLPRVTLVRPDGRREELATATAPDSPGTRRAAFLPDTAGDYAIALGAPGDDLPARAAFHAVARPGPAADGWARLALLAHRSGGAAVPADSVGPWLDRWIAEHDGAGARRIPLLALLFAIIALVAVGEWTLRRLAGRA